MVKRPVVKRPRAIRMSRTSYELLEQEARRRGIEPDALAEELLRADLGGGADENLDAIADLAEVQSGSPVAPAPAETPVAAPRVDKPVAVPRVDKPAAAPHADTPAVMSATTRRQVDAGMIVLAVAAAASTQVEAGSPVRALLVFAAFLLVPGWAFVSLLSSGPPAAMLGLAIGLSLTIDVAGSLVLVWTGRFDVLVLTGTVGTVAVLLLIADLVRQSQSQSSRNEASVPRVAG